MGVLLEAIIFMVFIWRYIWKYRLPWWLKNSKVSCLLRGRPGFDPWVGTTPWRRKWQATPILLPGKCHGQRSLAGYSLRGHKMKAKCWSLNHVRLFATLWTAGRVFIIWASGESDTTERLNEYLLWVPLPRCSFPQSIFLVQSDLGRLHSTP